MGGPQRGGDEGHNRTSPSRSSPRSLCTGRRRCTELCGRRSKLCEERAPEAVTTSGRLSSVRPRPTLPPQKLCHGKQRGKFDMCCFCWSCQSGSFGFKTPRNSGLRRNSATKIRGTWKVETCHLPSAPDFCCIVTSEARMARSLEAK